MSERGKIGDMGSGADHAGSQKPAHNGAREPVPRRIYLAMRLEEIGADIADKARERERLTSELRDPSRSESPDQKQMRRRRAYLAERLAILRQEQTDLHAERKAMAVAGGFDREDRETANGRDGAKNPLIN